jgi:hypothetical protein
MYCFSKPVNMRLKHIPKGFKQIVVKEGKEIQTKFGPNKTFKLPGIESVFVADSGVCATCNLPGFHD